MMWFTSRQICRYPLQSTLSISIFEIDVLKHPLTTKSFLPRNPSKVSERNGCLREMTIVRWIWQGMAPAAGCWSCLSTASMIRHLSIELSLIYRWIRYAPVSATTNSYNIRHHFILSSLPFRTYIAVTYVYTIDIKTCRKKIKNVKKRKKRNKNLKNV